MIEKTLADRLNYLLNETKTSKTELADAIGIKQPSVNDLCSGKSKSMKAVTALKVAEFFNVSLVWLVEGKGPMRSDSIELAPDVEQVVPLISWVQAGDYRGIEWPDDAEPIPTPRRMPKNSYALRVRGESMLPKFEEGDIIFVNPEGEFRNKSFVIACNSNNETTFKQLISDGEVQYLRPLNQNWPGPQVISLDEGTRIIGLVTGKYVDML